MEESKLRAIDKKNIWHPFSPLAGNDPIPVVKASGCYLYTADGRKIMDAISSWWVNIHGHGHPIIAKAIADQAVQLEHVIFAGFTHIPAIELSERLMALLPKDQSKIFFSDDGSTATEVAIKLSIQYWHNKGVKRKKIIAIEGAYHGDTFGAMSVGDRDSIFNVPFVDYLFDVEYLPFPEGDGKNTIEVMRTIADDSVAAFIFEPLVQGAAGMRIYKPDVLEQLMETAHAHQIICIADEVMTGFGRTGKTFACDYLNTQPDIFCLSKGITGGFLPMGVTTVNERIAEAFNHADKSKAFFHGHSYTANPMACASAVASMDLLTSETTQADIRRISEKHEQYLSTFRFHDQVDHAKTLGTILSITLPANDSGYVSSIKERIYDFFMDRNLLLRPLGNVIYLIPPYVITDEMLDEVYGAIDAFFEDLLLDS